MKYFQHATMHFSLSAIVNNVVCGKLRSPNSLVSCNKIGPKPENSSTNLAEPIPQKLYGPKIIEKIPNPRSIPQVR